MKLDDYNRLLGLAPWDEPSKIDRVLHYCFPSVSKPDRRRLMMRNWLITMPRTSREYVCGSCDSPHSIPHDGIEFRLSDKTMPRLIRWLGYNGYHQYAKELALVHAAHLLQKHT